ncbi:adenosylcobinamide-GDP ribazoletransferase [Acididesulfobacillus acetoxydans]|uniref:Adenosylcobinamide-GDP ribazoletransferase n=1 Tax=Acididesulfobacillus acetoxydans TaxID=1561005 RepID=A0A8S0WPA0_9FIRM|nr:adenosylcobinamide-GDP ribazoletransferase [Acididesulfobacillus acetoxydans]CAA7601784.1 adenosylcobinamide-GDP ribazoletransferase [Acididesulfobacillus acetoxydans]CEJ09204.1 Cobalamin synthase [Acididesulfobacillus acetoxydans]
MRGLLIALTFLTRLPLPAPRNVSAAEFKHSQHYYPLVGLILGGFLWLAGRLTGPYYPPLVVGAILLALELALTGGIHLDGFMDSMDGLLSARTPERKLEIMKDSRVGAHASISLAALLLLKFSLLASLKPADMGILLLMPMISRWAFLIGVIGFPYARKEGLGQGFHEASRWLVFAAEGLIILGFAVWFLGPAGLAAILAASALAGLFSWRVSGHLGGLTGDIYGATIELAEVFALLAAFPFLH